MHVSSSCQFGTLLPLNTGTFDHFKITIKPNINFSCYYDLDV